MVVGQDVKVGLGVGNWVRSFKKDSHRGGTEDTEEGKTGVRRGCRT